MEAKIKSQTAFEESSLKGVVEDCPAGLRGVVGFMKRALDEEGVGPEAGRTCLSPCGLDRSEKVINWKNTLISERSRYTEQAVDLWFP